MGQSGSKEEEKPTTPPTNANAPANKAPATNAPAPATSAPAPAPATSAPAPNGGMQGGKRRRKTRGRKSKRGRQTISKRLRKHAHSHTKRHIKCMRALIKQGYSFKKAHRAALRKVGH